MRAYERLLRYAACRTPSDEEGEGTPSTPEQHELAAHLAEEMKALGLSDVLTDGHAYVYGRLPASPGHEGRTPVGFIAHIDTVPVPEGAQIRPSVVKNYDGGDIPLGDSGLILSSARFPHLRMLVLRDQYYNMAEVLRECPEVLEKARAAIREAGLAPVSHPVRGGTDGAQLSFRGLPCPNLGTGGFCFHGPYEHASVQRMDRAVEILLGLVRQYAGDETAEER